MIDLDPDGYPQVQTLIDLRAKIQKTTNYTARRKRSIPFPEPFSFQGTLSQIQTLISSYNSSRAFLPEIPVPEFTQATGLAKKLDNPGDFSKEDIDQFLGFCAYDLLKPVGTILGTWSGS